MSEKPPRQPIAFDNLDPKRIITDPDNLGAERHWPKALYRFVPHATEDSLIVAWKGKEPIHNESIRVHDETALEEHVTAGWATKPQMTAAPTKKAAA